MGERDRADDREAEPGSALGTVARCVGAEVDRLDVEELCLFGLGEPQQVVDQAGDAGDLGLDEALDAPHLLDRRVPLGAEHFELPPDHGQRSAQLVRRVRHERALAGERGGEPVGMLLFRVNGATVVVGPWGGEARRGSTV
jgi:hypothetical protein